MGTGTKNNSDYYGNWQPLTSQQDSPSPRDGQWAFEVLYKPDMGKFGHFYVSLVYSSEEAGKRLDQTVFSIGRMNFLYLTKKNQRLKYADLISIEEDLLTDKSSGSAHKIYTQERYLLSDEKQAAQILCWMYQLIADQEDLYIKDLMEEEVDLNNPYTIPNNYQDNLYYKKSCEVATDLGLEDSGFEGNKLLQFNIHDWNASSLKNSILNNQCCKGFARYAVNCLIESGMIDKKDVITSPLYSITPWFYGYNAPVEVAYKGIRFKPSNLSPPKIRIFIKRKENNLPSIPENSNGYDIFYIVESKKWIIPDGLSLPQQVALEHYLKRKAKDLNLDKRLMSGSVNLYQLSDLYSSNLSKKIITRCQNILMLDEDDIFSMQESKEAAIDEKEADQVLNDEISEHYSSDEFYRPCEDYLNRYTFGHFFGRCCVKQAKQDLETRSFSPSQFYMTFFGLFFQHQAWSKPFCYFFHWIYSNANSRWNIIEESKRNDMKTYLELYSKISNQFTCFITSNKWNLPKDSKEMTEVSVFFEYLTNAFDSGFQNEYQFMESKKLKVEEYIKNHIGCCNDYDVFFEFLNKLSKIEGIKDHLKLDDLIEECKERNTQPRSHCLKK